MVLSNINTNNGTHEYQNRLVKLSCGDWWCVVSVLVNTHTPEGHHTDEQV